MPFGGSAFEFGGNALNLLEKKQMEEFLHHTKLSSDAFMKWTKKKEGKNFMFSLIHSITVYASCSNESNDSIDLRKTLINDRIVPSLKEDSQFGMKLVNYLLELESKYEVYKENVQWMRTDYGKAVSINYEKLFD